MLNTAQGRDPQRIEAFTLLVRHSKWRRLCLWPPSLDLKRIGFLRREFSYCNVQHTPWIELNFSSIPDFEQMYLYLLRRTEAEGLKTSISFHFKQFIQTITLLCPHTLVDYYKHVAVGCPFLLFFCFNSSSDCGRCTGKVNKNKRLSINIKVAVVGFTRDPKPARREFYCPYNRKKAFFVHSFIAFT